MSDEKPVKRLKKALNYTTNALKITLTGLGSLFLIKEAIKRTPTTVDDEFLDSLGVDM